MALAVYNSASFISATGLAVAAGATIEVRREDTDALVPIYADLAGTTPITNPSNFADSSGRFVFYVEPVTGGFSVKVTKGAETYTLHDVLIGITAGDFPDLASTTDVLKGDALVGVKLDATGAAARNQHDKNADLISSADFPTDPTGVSDSTQALLDWFTKITATGKEGIWASGVYLHNLKLDITGDAVIRLAGKVTLQATATMDYQLRHSAELTIGGEGSLLFDGDAKVTYACLHSTAKLPKLRNVRFLDSNFGWNTGATVSAHDYGVTGDGILENVVAENCLDVGFSARGNITAGSRTATLQLLNCKTKGTTGSDNYDGSGVGYLFHISGMLSVDWQGGNYTGASTALLTNAYECSEAEVHGGYYHDIARGPTVGENTQNFIIEGTVCRTLTGNAINADTTDGVGETVGVGRISNNLIHACGRAVRATCSHVDVTDNFAYECTDTSGIFAFAGDGTDVWVDGNHCYSTAGSGAYTAFLATENAQVRYGKNWTNSTQRSSYLEEAGSQAFRGESRIMASSGDVRGQDHGGVIFMDCTSGAVDVDLPDLATMKPTGFEFTLIKVDTVNTGTVTFQGGAAGGETVNGITGFTIAATDKFRPLRFRCKDGTTGTWICEGMPGPNNINTTAVGNVGTGTDTLMNLSMAGSSLYQANVGLHIVQSGITANNANAKTLTSQAGGQVLVTQALTVSIAGEWLIEYDLISTGVDTQRYIGRLTYETAAGVWASVIFKGTLALDDGATIAIRCTGQATTDNDIVQEYQRVTFVS